MEHGQIPLSWMFGWFAGGDTGAILGGQQPHADNCSLRFDSPESIQLSTAFCENAEIHRDFCCIDRMYTAAVYLNQPGTVQGGNFLFWDHDAMDLWRLRTGFCHVKPECGTMVVFPSDGNHIHAVSPVLRGERSAIMTWYTNVSDKNTDGAILTPMSEWQADSFEYDDTV